MAKDRHKIRGGGSNSKIACVVFLQLRNLNFPIVTMLTHVYSKNDFYVLRAQIIRFFSVVQGRSRLLYRIWR